jgi:hypothetical protein
LTDSRRRAFNERAKMVPDEVDAVRRLETESRVGRLLR